MTDDRVRRVAQDPTGAWVGAFFCTVFAVLLLGNVIAGGTDAPHYASDLGWMTGWFVGAVACVTTALVRLLRGGDDDDD